MSINPTTVDPNQFLMGGGIPSAKFDSVGVSVGGTITDIAASQQTDFTTGEPKTWPNGEPMMQVVVSVATEIRDPQITDDDGVRKIYVKGKSLTAAVRDAVRRAGAKGLENGGTLTVTYTGDGPQERRGINPPKLYAASYTKPTAVAANAALMGGGDAAPAPAARVSSPAGFDTENLSPEARAAVEAMLAAQAR